MKFFSIICLVVLCCVGNAQVPVPVGFFSSPSILIGTSFATNWANRVETNGGVRPADATIAALDTFYATLVASNIVNKMKVVNCYAADNLTACLTPLIVGAGYDPWRNTNFVAGDLTTNGLVGDGATKFLDTGFETTNSLPSNLGVTLYIETGNNNNEAESGAWDGGALNGYSLQVYGGSIYWDSPYSSANGRVTGAYANFSGYLSGNRIANNDSRIFQASSTSNHVQIFATQVNVVGDVDGGHWYIHAFNSSSTPLYFSTKRISFVAIHDGLTLNESYAFFTAIQTMRTALGGGWK